MDILQLRGTGSRNPFRHSGSSKVNFWASRDSAMLTMVSVWVKLCSKLWTEWALHTRSVLDIVLLLCAIQWAHDAYDVVVDGKTHAHNSCMYRKNQRGPTGAYVRMGQWRQAAHIHGVGPFISLTDTADVLGLANSCFWEVLATRWGWPIYKSDRHCRRTEVGLFIYLIKTADALGLANWCFWEVLPTHWGWPIYISDRHCWCTGVGQFMLLRGTVHALR